MWGQPELAAEARARHSREREAFGVYPWHWRTVRIWRAVWRQWRWVAGGMAAPQRDGLDWCQVRAVVELSVADRAEWPGILEGLQVMQDAALEFWREQSAK